MERLQRLEGVPCAMEQDPRLEDLLLPLLSLPLAPLPPLTPQLNRNQEMEGDPPSKYGPYT